MKRDDDAFGQGVWDFYQGQPVIEIIERRDGHIAASRGPAAYFAPISEWLPAQQAAIGLARGRCLDIGCGPGRHALYLQAQGLTVVGIDNSPLAVEVARRRGVADARVLSITACSRRALGVFDTIIMFGNNFGLFGSADRARWLLRRFYGMTAADGLILAESRDIYQTDDRQHLAYQAENRRRGRMSGQMRLRVRYGRLKGAWFDYLMVSPAEMEAIVAGTGWQIERLIQAPDEVNYVAVLTKD